MIRSFALDGEHLHPLPSLGERPEAAAWIDLLEPTRDEEAEIKRVLAVDLPTQEEMQEIEISSRLYSEHGDHFMTATVPAYREGGDPEFGPITFVLSKAKLITLRYHDPRAFKAFPMRAEKGDLGCTDGASILTALLEAIVDRLADLLERLSHNVIELSRDIFHSQEKKASKRGVTFQAILRRIGRKEDLISDMQESLHSLQRLTGYFGNVCSQRGTEKAMRERLKTLSRDIASLIDHASALSQKINFLLDATLGMISIEQNAIIKIFSVAAVVFLPPTLVASIYGMNFEHMPELRFAFGYPLALLLMIASAILPYLYFKRRGWL